MGEKKKTKGYCYFAGYALSGESLGVANLEAYSPW